MTITRVLPGTPAGGQFTGRISSEAGVTLVYSTQTGLVPEPLPEDGEPQYGYDDGYEEQAFCFVCSRPTDHFAEHDDLVESGEALYDNETGTVYSRRQAWAWPENQEQQLRIGG